MTHEQALRQAMKRLIDVLAVRGIGKEERDRRESEIQAAWLEGVAALSLPVPEITLEYRVVWEELTGYGESERWHQNRRDAVDMDAASLILKGWRSRSPSCFRNIRAESREIYTGPWLPVV